MLDAVESVCPMPSPLTNLKTTAYDCHHQLLLRLAGAGKAMRHLLSYSKRNSENYNVLYAIQTTGRKTELSLEQRSSICSNLVKKAATLIGNYSGVQGGFETKFTPDNKFRTIHFINCL